MATFLLHDSGQKLRERITEVRCFPKRKARVLGVRVFLFGIVEGLGLFTETFVLGLMKSILHYPTNYKE